MEPIENLKTLLYQRELDAVVICKPLNIFYFSGALVNGVLILTTGENYLFIRRPKERPLKLRSNVKSIYFDSLKELSQHLNIPIRKAGFELDSIPCSLIKRLSETLGVSDILDVTHDIRMIRMVKTPFEIEKISEAGKIVSKVFENVPKIFKDGMSERDLLIELEYISKKEGNIGFYRMHSFGNEASFSHILQGESALISSYLDAPTGGPGISDAFPQGASLKKIEKNKPFTIDVMVNFDGYLADATRTFVWGKVDESVEKAWQRLYEIFLRVEADLTPGSIPENIYQKTLELAHSLGVEHIFMGPGKDKVKFIGHGLGLEVDEYPFIAKGFKIPLNVNSVVAIEPKFISDEFGILGLEDTFIITDNGPVSVINFPRDIFKL